MSERYDVVWPLGRRAAREVAANRAVSTLDGKTIAFVWDYLFKGDEMFALVEPLIRARFPDVRFVSHEEFGDIHGSVAAERAAVAALPDKLRQYRVDAAIVGVGA